MRRKRQEIRLDSFEPTVPAMPAVPAAVEASWPPLKRIAPWWHTLLLVAFVLGMSATSSQRLDLVVNKHGRLAMYLPTIAAEWLMVGYIAWGIRKSGTRVRDLVGGKWETPEDFLLDVALAVGAWIAIILLLACLAWAMGLTRAANVEQAKRQIFSLLPQSGAEIAVWTLLCATAGFCEEL